MANPEHVAILRQGVEAFYQLQQADPDASKDINRLFEIFEVAVINWDRWRQRNVQLEPDFSNIDPHGPDASGFFLQEANLSSTNFSNSNLSRALLRKADITYSNLSRADLGKASLSHADFTGADLSNASLRSAKLLNTNFTGTTLRGADFTEAELGWTIFVSTDLSEAKGLDALVYAGPGFIDIETLYGSVGKVPEIFLNLCGVPDSFITFAQSLIQSGQVIQFYSCFISYSSKDQTFAERLHADLQVKGVRSWFAPEDLKIGAEIRTGIDESIRVHDKLLLVLSETSATSQWVQQEVETALAKEREQGRTVLFPIRLNDAVMQINTGWPAYLRNTRNIGDFRKWKNHDSYQKAFDRLLRDLKAEEKQA